MSRDDGLASRASALRTVLAPAQRFSHLTAAELHGMRLPEGVRRAIHVTGRGVARGVRRPGVIGHRSSLPVTPVRIAGLPVSPLLIAWAECAELLTVEELVVVGDGLVRRRDPPATVGELEHVVRSRGSRRGAARLRAALDLIRPGTDSARETMLRLAVLGAGFPAPEVNAPLLDDRGTVVAHGDLVWPRERVVLEYDGRHHAEDARQFAVDIRRLDDIAAAGYRVVRIDRRLFQNRADLFRRIANARAAGSRGVANGDASDS